MDRSFSLNLVKNNLTDVVLDLQVKVVRRKVQVPNRRLEPEDLSKFHEAIACRVECDLGPGGGCGGHSKQLLIVVHRSVSDRVQIHAILGHLSEAVRLGVGVEHLDLMLEYEQNVVGQPEGLHAASLFGEVLLIDYVERVQVPDTEEAAGRQRVDSRRNHVDADTLRQLLVRAA